MKFRRGIILFFFFACLASMAIAQPDQYKFTRLGVDQGLSNNQPKCFLRDSKGFIWIGTVSGLNRFDGTNLKIFRNIPSDTTSLADSEINSVHEGPEGKIWVGTYAGVNIYDPETEKFQRESWRTYRKYSLPDGLIVDIQKDAGENYWFIHSSQGLFRHAGQSNETLHLEHLEADTTSIASNQILAMEKDPSGNYWMIHKSGVLEMMDGNTLKIVYRNFELQRKYRGESLSYNLTVDSDGDVWVYASNSNKGVYYLSTSSKSRLTPINRSSAPLRLNSDIIGGIVQDNKGLLWIATDHGGINLLDKKKGVIRYILHDPDDEKTLSQSSVRSLYKDQEGFIWAGSFKRGVNYFHENVIRFQLFRHYSLDPGSLPFNDANCFAEDEKGNLWIGTNGGGLIYYDRASEKFTRYQHDPKNENSLSNNVIVSMCYDRKKNLWVGTYFGGLNKFDGKTFIRYRHNPGDPGSIGDDSVWEIFEDTQSNLWIGTLNSGVDLYNYNTNSFSHYRVGDANSVHSTYVPVISGDKQGNIWIGTGYGIDLYDRQTGRFIHYLNDGKNRENLVNNSIYSILEDSRGIIWIGTKEGLNAYDRDTNSFKSYREQDGLPHHSVLTLLEDEHGNLWLSTPNGISNLILTRGKGREIISLEFKNHDEADGLQGKQFNEGAAFKTSRGELIFGGANGFNLFRPDDIIVNQSKPRIILSDFQVFNKSVQVGELINGKVLLTKSILETKEITLDYSENVFSLEFTALSFFQPQKSMYRYALEGFNKAWTTTDGSQRKVTYTNLDPGEYTFIVKASNNDGVWNEDGLRLKINILPPFWKTKTAFVLYVFLIFGALLLSRRLILERERMKYRIEKERQEANHLHELDMMKIKFFTNVSHEFRTPLSLIITPLEKILKNAPSDQKSQFLLIYRNARRLLNLVNQLLDFRRIEVQEVKLNPWEGDIVHFIEETSHSFSDMSEKKNITFSVHSDVDHLETTFDKDKLEKILFNLLSNAFKFTPEGGTIDVSVRRLREGDTHWLEIRVKDTGIGIPVEKQDKIFERFFQHDLPKSMVNQGSGIGLSITSEFVKAHEGRIVVESEPGKGSCFVVLLPIHEISPKIQGAIPEVGVVRSELIPEWAHEESPGTSVKNKKPVLLIVEDNEDFRFYLKDNLKSTYQIVEARNGREGLESVNRYLPDLIVSDIMMPEMDGFAFCKKVKTEPTTSHIPVILLTARSAEDQKLEGFETGADDYITKPFNFEILQSRIKNLIHQRELFHKDFRKQIEIRATDINITSLDEKLIQNAIRLVEDNISNADFSVEDLSHELGMSRVHLYKKLLSLTGKAPLEFIRSIRLQRAAQLLEKSQLTVAEVAYKVGFNNPKYFTKYFKDEFNMLPSMYPNKKSKET